MDRVMFPQRKARNKVYCRLPRCRRLDYLYEYVMTDVPITFSCSFLIPSIETLTLYKKNHSTFSFSKEKFKLTLFFPFKLPIDLSSGLSYFCGGG